MHRALAVRVRILGVEEAVGHDAHANAGRDSDGRGRHVVKRIVACVLHEDVEAAIVRVDLVGQADVHLHVELARVALLQNDQVAARVEAIADEIGRMMHELEKGGVAYLLIEVAAELHVLEIAHLLELVAGEQIAARGVQVRLHVGEHLGVLAQRARRHVAHEVELARLLEQLDGVRGRKRIHVAHGDRRKDHVRLLGVFANGCRYAVRVVLLERTHDQPDAKRTAGPERHKPE